MQRRRTPAEIMGSLKRFLRPGESAVEDLRRERDGELAEEKRRWGLKRKGPR